MTSLTLAIRIEDLSFSWQRTGRPDLMISELSLNEGEMALITGPSGSGKTSLLNLLSGVTVADSGRLEVLGQDMSVLGASNRDAFRADNIGLIFQIFNLLPYLSVLENIILAGTFSAERQRRSGDLEAQAHTLLEALDLPPGTFAARKVNTLSIGQQQRVAAARALAGNPRLIIADEPTSALVAANRDRFIDLITNLCRDRGATLVVVSHDQALTPFFDRRINMPDINRAMIDKTGAA